MTRKRFPRLLAALGHACVTCEATAARGTSPDALAPIFSSREPSEPGEGDKGDEVATSAVRSLCHDGPGLEWDVVASGRRTRCYHWHHAYRQVRAWRAVAVPGRAYLLIYSVATLAFALIAGRSLWRRGIR